jgi:hypothetical protein
MKGSCCSYDFFLLLLAAAAEFLNGIRVSACHDCFDFFLWEGGHFGNILPLRYHCLLVGRTKA